ncbi:MAG: sulfatase-like hydrolase/transferase, partial [Verrucomicrobiota bacterium]
SNATGIAQASVELFVGPPRPNVVLFLVDDMGITDTSVPFVYTNGVEVPHRMNTNLYVTPNMELLAARGMKFTAAYSQTVCSPTRTSLMTGLNAPGHGVTCWVNPAGTSIGANAPVNYLRQGMTGFEETLPKWLSEAGYLAIHSGKAHFTHQFNPSVLDPEEEPTHIGFDINIAGSYNGQPGSYLGTANYANGSRPSWTIPGLEDHHGTTTFLTEACTIEANEAVTETVNRGRPFFLYLSHYALHSPFTSDPRATNAYASLTGAAQRFATMIEGMDRSLGDVLTHLDTLGVAEDTLIFFLGDNGSDNPLNNHEAVPDAPWDDFLLRGKKGGEWEGGSRVPLIAAWARPNPANPFQQAMPIVTNSVEHDIVACWDLPVTIMSAAGLPIPGPVHGHDLSGYLAGTPGEHRPQDILLYSPHGRNGDYFANYRVDHWKLIYRWQSDTFALYDLAVDPTEMNNLAGSQPAKLLEMARGMARQFDEEWGPLGTLWPTFGPLSVSNLMGALDLDGDGLPDAAEDPDGNGLLDPGETDPDDRDT